MVNIINLEIHTHKICNNRLNSATIPPDRRIAILRNAIKSAGYF